MLLFQQRKLTITKNLRSFRSLSTCMIQDNQFTLIASTFLQKLQHQIEESDNPIFEDSNYADGVVNIEMRGQKYYVLNKQTPNRQIWLSSPFSGPSRFEIDEKGEWKQNRTKEDLLELLEKEFNEKFAKNEREKIKLKYE